MCRVQPASPHTHTPSTRASARVHTHTLTLPPTDSPYSQVHTYIPQSHTHHTHTLTYNSVRTRMGTQAFPISEPAAMASPAQPGAVLQSLCPPRPPPTSPSLALLALIWAEKPMAFVFKAAHPPTQSCPDTLPSSGPFFPSTPELFSIGSPICLPPGWSEPGICSRPGCAVGPREEALSLGLSVLMQTMEHP